MAMDVQPGTVISAGVAFYAMLAILPRLPLWCALGVFVRRSSGEQQITLLRQFIPRRLPLLRRQVTSSTPFKTWVIPRWCLLGAYSGQPRGCLGVDTGTNAVYSDTTHSSRAFAALLLTICRDGTGSSDCMFGRWRRLLRRVETRTSRAARWILWWLTSWFWGSDWFTDLA
jgi:membrane protein